jgi:hypothetical protein
MPAKQQSTRSEKPSDKYARSDQAPPPGRRRIPQNLSDENSEDIVEKSSEDSFPASDAPAYTQGRPTGDEASESAPGP